MNPLKNPYIRIAIGAALSQYLAPKIVQRFVRVELEEIDATINDATAIGITAGITTLTFVALGMLAGETLGAAVKAGPA